MIAITALSRNPSVGVGEGVRYHDAMDDFEKRWKRIQDQLRIQMNGDEQPRFSSGRTLFGIRSEAELKMDRFAREMEEEARQKRLEKQHAERGGDAATDSPADDARRED
ncbi:MAG: hypothetical protein U0L71_06210 [Eggerthellaceae bacterium]|nr:hypothetical protein [Eggerthellaceae bacterium]